MAETRKRRIVRRVTRALVWSVLLFAIYLSSFGAYLWFCGQIVKRNAFQGANEAPFLDVINAMYEPLYTYEETDWPGARILSTWSRWCLYQGLDESPRSLEEIKQEVSRKYE